MINKEWVKDKLELLARLSNDVVWEVDLDFKSRFISSSLLEQRGFTPEEFAELPLSGIFRPESLVVLNITLARELEKIKLGLVDINNYSIELELEHYCKDGTSMWGLITATGVWDDDKNFIGIQGITRNIHQRKMAESELLKKEEKYRTIIELAVDAIFIGDTEGNFIDVNTKATELTGYQKAELLGKNISLFFSESELKRYPLRYDIIDKGDVIKNQRNLTRKDGSKVMIEMYSKKNPNGTYQSFFRNISDRINTQEKISKNEKLLATLTSDLPIVLYAIDKDGIFSLSEGKALESLGLLPGQIVGLSVFEVYKESPEIIESMNRALKGEIVDFITTVGDVTFESVVKPSFDENNNILGLIGVSFDISERIKVENELKEREINLKLITENMADTICHMDASRRIIYVSPSIKSVFGWEIEDILGHEITDLVHQEDIDAVFLDTKKAVDNKKDSTNIQYRYLHKDGIYRWVESAINFLYNNRNELDGVIFSSREISKRKETEDALKKSEEKYRILSELVSDGASSAILTPEGKLIREWATEKLFRTYGINPDELASVEDWLKIVHPDDIAIFTSGMREVLSGKQSSAEFRIIIKSGEVRWINHNVYPRINENNKFIGLISAIKDITERKKYEEDLKLSKQKAEESDRLKSTFLANMSHEIRTPLNSIIGFTNVMLAEDNKFDKKSIQFLNIVHSNAYHLLSLINDIIDLSKIEAGQLIISESEISLNQFLKEIYNHFHSELETRDKNLVRLLLNTSLPFDNCTINIDDFRLKQILTNLLSNAVKFTKSGVIEFGYTITKDEKFFRFFVADTGIGIDETKKRIIFERFRQADESFERRYGGTGLGLAISSSLIELMSGKIWLESELGKGATFYFSLPYNKIGIDRNATIRESSTNESLNLQNKKILIVEDDESSFLFLKVFFERSNAIIFRAEDGESAIQITQENPDLIIIFMDINLPGINGYGATTEIRKFNEKIPIIAQTAYAYSEDRKKCIDAGCTDYISKPIEIKLLQSIIKKYLLL